MFLKVFKRSAQFLFLFFILFGFEIKRFKISASDLIEDDSKKEVQSNKKRILNLDNISRTGKSKSLDGLDHEAFNILNEYIDVHDLLNVKLTSKNNKELVGKSKPNILEMKASIRI